MKKNIFKILIIIMCFVFVLIVAMNQPIIPSENEQESVEKTEEETSEENKVDDSYEEMQQIALVNNPELRILITTNGFTGSIHEKVKVTSGEDFSLLGEDGTVYANYNAWEMIDLDQYNLKVGETLIFKSEGQMAIHSITREQGTPEYYGSLQICKEDNGYSIINIVPMEQYLLTVVPSEMPSFYPLEALKAQAVCARSYAYHYVLNEPGLPHGAHMNDSTDYQVYNNIQETENTNLAVKETEGMVLTRDGEPVQTYFFSTSCGFTTNETIWKEYFSGEEWINGEMPKVAHNAGQTADVGTVCFESVAVAQPKVKEAISTDSGIGILYTADSLVREDNFRAYITSDTCDFLEVEEQWYRWSYRGTITSEAIEERLKDRYMARPDLILTLDKMNNIYVNQEVNKIGEITNIEVIKRLPGGVADELLIETTKDTYLIIGEYNIRYVLSDGISEVIRNDGSTVTVSNLLPSAYFIIEPEISASGTVEGIVLTGGGYGHGVGMSQNGAKQAALQGMDCEDILKLFYKGLELKTAK